MRDGVYWLDFEPQLTIQARTNPQLVNGIVIRNVGIYSYTTNRWALTPDPHSFTIFATCHPLAAQNAVTRSTWLSRLFRFSADETRAYTATFCRRAVCDMGGAATITVPEGT